MKCENCGGNLSLEEVACPHCGTINKHAQQHVYDMNRYQGEFANTQSDVYEVTRNYAGITVRAVIITVLLIVIGIMTFVISESYSIERGLGESKANRNYKEYSAIMDAYLAEENYLAFNAFCEINHVDYHRAPYEEYVQLARVSNDYKYLYETIMDIAMSRDDEEMELLNQERWLDRITEELDSFYKNTDVNEYRYYDGVDTEEKQAIVEKMKESMELLLQTYFGLTAEEAAGLEEMSAAKRAVLLEEKLGYGK